MSWFGNRSTGAKLRSVLAVVIVAVVATGAASALSDDDSGGTVHLVAEFADASPLLVGGDVKIAGVKVGKTVSMKVKNNAAHVELELEQTALPLYRDATATIRPVSLLGERFVALERGTASSGPMSDGGMIPRSRTGQNVDLDEVLNALDDPTSGALAALVTTLGDGMQGNGSNLNAAIKALGPAMHDTDQLMQILHEQNAVLNQLVDDAVPVAKALAARDGKSMDQLVSAAEKLLATTSGRQRKFDQSLEEMPSTLRAARSVLAQLTDTANKTTPTLAALRPTTDDLATMSRELQSFSQATNHALRSANPLLAKANKLLDRAQPVIAELRRSGPDARALSAAAAPTIRQLSVHFDDVMAAIRNWSLASNGEDGLSHYFRGLLVVSPETVTGLLPAQKQNPGSATPELPLPGLGSDGKPLEGLLSPQTSDDGGVTGLNEQQESGLLGSILGGI